MKIERIVSDATLVVRFVDDCDAIPAELWDSCFCPPREGVWWYRGLQNSGLDDQFRFFYAVIEQPDSSGLPRPVGIAPCFIADVPMDAVLPPYLVFLLSLPSKVFPSLGYQRTLFIGNPCSDEGWVGLLPGVDRRAALLAVHDAVQCEAKRLRAPMMVWKDCPAEMRHDMAWLGLQRGLFGMHSYPNALMTFEGTGKDGYFAQLKGSRRHQLKKKLRTSAQQFDAVADVIQCPTAAVMDEIFGLFQQTFEKSDVQFERLNRQFFEQIAQAPQAHFLLLRDRQSGDLVAFMLCLTVGDLVINKFIGFDYARPREWLLYFRLWDAAVDWALARGASGIQSGQTCYAPKIEQGHSLSPLYHYVCHANRLVHWVYGKVARTVTWHSLDDDLARFLKAHPEATPEEA